MPPFLICEFTPTTTTTTTNVDVADSPFSHILVAFRKAEDMEAFLAVQASPTSSPADNWRLQLAMIPGVTPLIAQRVTLRFPHAIQLFTAYERLPKAEAKVMLHDIMVNPLAF